MYEAKTKPTQASVTAYLSAITDETRRKDCKELAKLMSRVTGCKPQMWGASIVGFDRYHYRYASGHEGEACVVGFSARKGDISVYVYAGFEGASSMLASLGKHKLGKACLYLKRLADVELPVLEQLLTQAVAETKRRYPTGSQ